MRTTIVSPVDPKRWQMRLFGIIQMGFLGWAIYWSPYHGYISFAHLPPPGYAVAVIAIEAALMSIQGEMKGWQKAAWMLIIGAFLIIELSAIKLDRATSDQKATTDKKDQDANFIAVRTAQDAAFTATASALTATINGLSDNLKTETKTFEQTRPRAFVSFQDAQYLTNGIQILGRVSYKNSGNDSARNLYKFGKIYVAPADIDSARKIIVPDFEKAFGEYKKSLKPQLVLVPGEPQRQEINFSLNSTDLHDLSLRKSQIYVVFRIQFSDSLGTWNSDNCDRTDDAAKNMPRDVTMNPSRHCRFFDEARYKFKK